MTGSMSWRFPAAAQYVAHARAVTAAYARWHGADEHDVALAVSEAVTNAIVHAYDDTNVLGNVEVIALRHPTELEIRIRDDGHGIRARDGHTPNPGLGQGLRIIRRITSRLELRARPEGGTQLCMRFPLA